MRTPGLGVSEQGDGRSGWGRGDRQSRAFTPAAVDRHLGASEGRGSSLCARRDGLGGARAGESRGVPQARVEAMEGEEDTKSYYSGGNDR